MRRTVLLVPVFSLAAWGCRGDKGPGAAPAGIGPDSTAPAADASTLAVIGDHAKRISELMK